MAGIKEGQVVNRLIEEVKKQEKKNQTVEDVIKNMQESAQKAQTGGKRKKAAVL